MSAAVTADSSVDRAWRVLGSVLDPEVPALSVVDLGLVRGVSVAGDGGLDIVLTPTGKLNHDRAQHSVRRRRATARTK